MLNEKWTTIEANTIEGTSLQSEKCRVSNKAKVLKKFHERWAGHKKVIVIENCEPNPIQRAMALEGWY